MWDVQHFWKSPEIKARTVFGDKGPFYFFIFLKLYIKT